MSSRCAAGKVPRFCLLAFAIILKPIAPCRQTAREFVASNNITAYVAILLQDFLLVYVSACPPCIPPSSKLPCDILDSDFCLFLNFNSTTSPTAAPFSLVLPSFLSFSRLFRLALLKQKRMCSARSLPMICSCFCSVLFCVLFYITLLLKVRHSRLPFFLLFLFCSQGRLYFLLTDHLPFFSSDEPCRGGRSSFGEKTKDLAGRR